MTGNNNIRIGTLFGIPFFVNPSWFLILGLVTWTYSNDLAHRAIKSENLAPNR